MLACVPCHLILNKHITGQTTGVKFVRISGPFKNMKVVLIYHRKIINESK